MAQQRARPSEDFRGRRATVDTGTVQCGESATCTLQSSLRAPAEVRRFVAEHLCAEHALLATAAVALVASELVTHAALLGEGSISLALRCDVTSLTLSVGFPRDVPAETSELRLGDPIAGMIVHSICRDSGTERSEHGLEMWCTIPTGYLPVPAPRNGGT